VTSALQTNPRFGVWLERLSRRGPAWVCALLGALMVLDLVGMAMEVRDSSHVPGAPPSRRAVRPPIDAQRIATANLFGVAHREPDPAQASVTTADLRLAGTIASAESRHGLAIIVANDNSRLYAVGDRIGGASLYSVYADRVILERGGRLETLSLPRKPLSGQLIAGASAAAPLQGEFIDSAGRVVDKQPGVFDKIMRAVDSYDKPGGKMRGFRVYPVAKGGALSALGLVPGDLLIAINGTELDNLRRSRQLIESLQSTGSAWVTVERQGQTLNVQLNVAEAEAEVRD
jgi:general secretion pathway protein C